MIQHTTIKRDLDDIQHDDGALGNLIIEADCTHIYEEAAILALGIESGVPTLLDAVEAFRTATPGNQRARLDDLRSLVVLHSGAATLELATGMMKFQHLDAVEVVLWERYGLRRAV